MSTARENAEAAPTKDVREALITILLDEGLESARGYGQPAATDAVDAILSTFHVTPKEEQ